MIINVSHIALFVPDLHEGEKFYKNLFDMELIGREAEKTDGLWYTLPFDKDWGDVYANGMDLGMTALRKGGFVLALFRGDKPSGQVYVIGLSVTREEIKTIHNKLAFGTQIDVYQPDRLEFMDPYQITWQLAVDPMFRTAGDFANRWLTI